MRRLQPAGRGRSPSRTSSRAPVSLWGPALPGELDGVGITPNAVARAIEDLKRSGYRPLHTRQAAPGPSSIPRARVAPVRDVCDGEAGHREIVAAPMRTHPD